MLQRRKKSLWTFDTSGGIGATAVFVAAGTGHIVLQPPGGGSVTFWYASLGGGVGLGLKNVRPSLGLASSNGGSLSTEDFFSAGAIWLLDSFAGSELTQTDIEGPCLMTELSAGVLLKGGSVTAMLLGLDARYLQEEIEADLIVIGAGVGGGSFAFLGAGRAMDIAGFQSSAKAALIMGGENVGSVGVSASASIGILWAGAAKYAPLPIIDVPVGPEPVRLSGRVTSKDVVLELPGDVLFGFDKDIVKRSAEPVLHRAGAVIKSHPDSHVLLYGHTDNVGQPWYNIDLSRRRAANVAGWLKSHGYAGSAHMSWFGFGQSHPVTSNQTEGGRKKNRRVEIRIFR
jgi:outer membrane protein OmpA-like peptidoglycan-associated protein